LANQTTYSLAGQKFLSDLGFTSKSAKGTHPVCPFFLTVSYIKSASILHCPCVFSKASVQVPTRIGRHFRRRNVAWPKQPHDFARLQKLVEAQPDATLAELGARLDRPFGTSTVDLWLHKLAKIPTTALVLSLEFGFRRMAVILGNKVSAEVLFPT
jgi:hypothetical protein